MLDIKKVQMYTDGACSGNPGPGGYGTILRYGEFEKKLSGGEAQTTNNRMELMAVIVGLKALNQKCCVDIYSDSKYFIDAIDKGWAKKWKSNGWMRNKKEKALNPDLWEEVLSLLEKHDVTLHWVTTDTRKTRSATEWQLNNLKNLADTIILKANKLR